MFVLRGVSLKADDMKLGKGVQRGANEGDRHEFRQEPVDRIEINPPREINLKRTKNELKVEKNCVKRTIP